MSEYKLVYVAKEVIQGIENELNELEDELDFIEGEIISMKCKHCKKYRDLKTDRDRVSKEWLEVAVILDVTIPF